MTYDWEFTTLDCYKSHEGEINVVFNVPWRFTARDGEYSSSSWGGLSVTYDPAGPDPFIPFEDLTEADVQGWCEAGLDVDAMKVNLDARVAEQENPTTEVLPPPWDVGD